MWYITAPKNHEVFARQAKRVSREWEFERIIPCHGDVVEKDAKGAWDSVMKWFLEMPDEKSKDGKKK